MKNILTKTLFNNYLPENKIRNTRHDFNNNISIRNATILIEHFFSPINVLASHPVFTITRDTVVIHLFYYIPNNGILNNNTVNNLGDLLTLLFGRRVQLRLVKQRYPYMDRYILAQYIALNTLDYKFTLITKKLFNRIKPVKDVILSDLELPSYIVGLKISISGRLITERSKPRKTEQTVQLGSFSNNNLSLIDTASFSSKNKKGSFTIKVWLVQQV